MFAHAVRTFVRYAPPCWVRRVRLDVRTEKSGEKESLRRMETFRLIRQACVYVICKACEARVAARTRIPTLKLMKVHQWCGKVAYVQVFLWKCLQGSANTRPF